MTIEVKRQVTIVNELGLHARAAAKLVKLASRFESAVRLRRDEQAVDAKSIMAVMMLAAGKGVRVEIEANGLDADEVVSELEALIQDRFGEPE